MNRYEPSQTVISEIRSVVVPITNYGSNITIAYFMPEVTNMVLDVPDMALDTAIWLQAKHNIIKWRSEGQSEEELNGPLAYLSQQSNLELANRAYVAATRGYRPALATPYGELTPTGQIIASKASDLLRFIMRNGPRDLPNLPDVLDQNKWEAYGKADVAFLRASIPTKVINLLKTMHSAITNTEQRFAARMREIATANPNQYPSVVSGNVEQFSDFVLPGINYFSGEYGKNSSTTTVTRTERNLEQITQDRYKATALIEMQKRSYAARQVIDPVSETCLFSAPMTDPHDNTKIVQLWQAWVPASIFLPNTRNDMKILYRFCLVDTSSYTTSGRGRPRIVVRPSSVGRLLLKNLEDLGI